MKNAGNFWIIIWALPIFLVQIFGYFFCGITMVRLVRNSGENLEFSDSEFLEVEREKSYLY